ncbi:MAG: DUF1015 domain-containing protein [Dehalococcoidia bacterium]|nr:DUF1015 domain-containing protein [Dehalococcoidia bacterium]MSQ16221.1 DUF1015 domain-containing protein [Dehalococcoidia bacterium]
MVDFRPFRGWRYDPQAAGDLSDVICPPYDLISPEMEEALRQRSPYNVVHLEGGEAPRRSSPQDDPYARAAALFAQWQRQGVLRRDAQPSFYLVRHNFGFGGQARSRLELYGCLRTEEYASLQVLPHEFTRPAPVRDRIALMEAAQANFSPIMSLYRDREGALPPVFQQVMARKPTVQAQGVPQQNFAMWAITAPEQLRAISRALAQKVVFLADGHHRYEAALHIHRQHAGDPSSAGNFVLMALIGFDEPGLVLLPYHRVLGGLTPAELAQVRQRLDELFDSQNADLTTGRAGEGLAERVLALGQHQQVMGLVSNDRNAKLLSLRDRVDRREWGPMAVSEAWVLEEQVLKPVLGETTARHLTYLHDHQTALAQVRSGAQQLAFLLRPFPLDHFEAIVGEGQRLPSKSTFFYPKLATGLVINQLSGPL